MTQHSQQPKQSPQDPEQDSARRSHAARSAGHRGRPESTVRSTLDIEGVDLDLTTDEVVDLVREGRERRG